MEREGGKPAGEEHSLEGDFQYLPMGVGLTQAKVKLLNILQYRSYNIVLPLLLLLRFKVL